MRLLLNTRNLHDPQVPFGQAQRQPPLEQLQKLASYHRSAPPFEQWVAVSFATGEPLEVVPRCQKWHGDTVLPCPEPHQRDHEVDRAVYVSGEPSTLRE